VLVALQALPATNLAGCTEVNGKSISHKYVPGTGLLLDLVAMLIIDAHGKWTAGSAPLASDARISSRHCKGAPAMPFPLLQMASITTSPINCFVPVEYWQTTPKLSIARLSIGIWWS
jgi:hypothetical protein